MQKTLSITIGKGSIGHNNRAFFADNIDSTRSQNNIIFHKENIKEVYHELFGTALEEYNAKQKHKDRIIKDYYDHIFHSKQEKTFYELIIQVGNKDDTPCNSNDGKMAAQILIKFEKEFQKRNPHIRVFNSVLHMDEHTPHLHIDFVPFATNQKRVYLRETHSQKLLNSKGLLQRVNSIRPQSFGLTAKKNIFQKLCSGTVSSGKNLVRIIIIFLFWILKSRSGKRKFFVWKIKSSVRIIF